MLDRGVRVRAKKSSEKMNVMLSTCFNVLAGTGLTRSWYWLVSNKLSQVKSMLYKSVQTI